MGNPRYANGHARRQAREWLRAQGLPCHICGRAIDYSLPARHPMSFEVDEYIPVSRGGSPYDRSNLRAAHRICNERRGNRPLPAGGAARKGCGAQQVHGVPEREGSGEAAGVAQASTRDIELAIADEFGPRPSDLTTEDASLF